MAVSSAKKCREADSPDGETDLPGGVAMRPSNEGATVGWLFSDLSWVV
jgi:hypothetical protein